VFPVFPLFPLFPLFPVFLTLPRPRITDRGRPFPPLVKKLTDLPSFLFYSLLFYSLQFPSLGTEKLGTSWGFRGIPGTSGNFREFPGDSGGFLYTGKSFVLKGLASWVFVEV
jgi:hypothetical protein